MGDEKVTKIKVKGKTIISSDRGQKVEVENPEILVIKKGEHGK